MTSENETVEIFGPQEGLYDRTYLEEKDGVYTYRMSDSSIIEKYDELFADAFTNVVESLNEVMEWQNQSYRKKENYTASSLVLRNSQENSVVKTGSYYEMDYNFDINNVAYTYVDLDSDGTFEMILGILPTDDDMYWAQTNIFERAYALVDGKVVKFVEGGSRDTYWLEIDGYIYETGSSGAAYSGTSKLRFDKSLLNVSEGTDWGGQGFIEGEFLGYWERPVHITGPYTDIYEAAELPENHISDDDWSNLEEEWEKRIVEIEWLKMSDYMSKHNR